MFVFGHTSVAHEDIASNLIRRWILAIQPLNRVQNSTFQKFTMAAAAILDLAFRPCLGCQGKYLHQNILAPGVSEYVW